MQSIGQLLKSKEENPKATLLMLFLNAVSETYYLDANGEEKRAKESMELMQKFIPMTPMTMMALMGGEQAMVSNPEWIRVSSCYTMFGDFDKAFKTSLKDVRMDRVAKAFGMVAKKKHTIVDPWPLRITEKNTQEDFDLLCGSNHTGAERYMEIERIEQSA